MSTFFQWCRRNAALLAATAVIIFGLAYSPWFAGLLATDLAGRLADGLVSLLPWMAYVPRKLLLLLFFFVEVVLAIFLLRHFFKLAHRAMPERPDLSKLSPEELQHRRNRGYVTTWVFGGALASFTFALLTFGVEVAAYYAKWIPADAMWTIASKVWPIVCLLEVFMQVVPMNVRRQTQGWDIVADQWTSHFPWTACVAVFVAMIFGGFNLGEAGWWILAESFGTALIELQLLALSNKLIAAARGEEKVA